MSQFKPYPAYRDSGAEWLGEVPDGWSVIPVKRDMSFLTSGSRGWASHYSEDGAAFIRIGNLTRSSICLDLSDLQRVVVPEGVEGERTKVCAGDVLFSITAYLGSVAVVPDGLEMSYVSQHVALLRLFGKKLLPRWVAYVTLSQAGQNYFASQGYGGTKVQLSLDDIAGLTVTAPSLSEQHKIANFLDHETARIDALIEEQRHLIVLLKEKRLAVISHAVTKGLDPTVPMKSSGVEWLGKVPAHWAIVRIGAVYSEAVEKGLAELPVLRVSIHYGVSDKELTEEESDRKVTRIEDREKYKRVRPGDLVYNMMRAWQGGFGAVLVDGLVSPAYVVARPKSGDISRYVEQLLRTSCAVEEMRKNSYGITDFRLRLYWDQFKNIRIALPPEKERQSIMERIDAIIGESEALRDEADQLIGILQERRSALISAAVTGKVDVRNWQPSTGALSTFKEHEVVYG